MSSDTNSLAHTKWNCKYHMFWLLNIEDKLYGKIKKDIGLILRQLCERKAIENYIRNQLQEDIVAEQLTLVEYINTFTGEEIRKKK